MDQIARVRAMSPVLTIRILLASVNFFSWVPNQKERIIDLFYLANILERGKPNAVACTLPYLGRTSLILLRSLQSLCSSHNLFNSIRPA